MLKSQCCDCYGDQLSDEEWEECIIPEDDDVSTRPFMHKCMKEGVYYFRTMEDSVVWGVYNDDKNILRCKYCDGMWPITYK